MVTPRGHALRVEGLAGRWGGFQLAPVTLHVPAGSYLSVLGPSGCGKTTLIELICGLRRPAAGRIFVDGRDVTHADPADRQIGYVPQDYQLFPSHSAAWNIGCAARIRKQPKHEARERLAYLAKTLHIESILDQNVQTLSGGERQRVALARALMVQPDILLLDEPVSALPESLRDRICRELKQVQTELGITTIHVSHNLDEALSVADRMAIMDVGCVVQEGSPEEILDRPASRFVAEFTQCRNLWRVEVRDGRIRLGGQELGAAKCDDGPYWATIRPEHLGFSPDGLPARVVDSMRISHAVLTQVELAGAETWVRDDHVRTRGNTIAVSIPEGRLNLYSR